MSRVPIRIRLTLAFAVVMAGVLTAVALLVYLRLGGALLGSVDQALRSQGAEAVAHAQRDDPVLIDNDVTGGTTLAQHIAPDGTIVRSSPPSLQRLLPDTATRKLTPGSQLLRSVELSRPEGDWRVLATGLGPGGGIVLVARSLEPREESLHRLVRELLVAGPLALLLASLAGYALAAAALRPVERMRRRASAVTAASPGRLPVPPSGDEISRLATTLNDMLARLEAAFVHERRFVADASHELRTPLALLRAELEIALRRPRSVAELERTIHSAVEETERLSRLAEDLLLIARADRGPLPVRRERIAAEDVLGAVASRFGPSAATGGRAVRVETTDAVLDVDPARIEQALGNLVENALNYGDGPVVLFAYELDDSVELHVADDGDGFPDDFLPRAFDRFSRADEARGRGGTGLGLSIVELVAAAHGGSAHAANRRGRGADVWISLPRAARGASRAPAPAFT